MNQSRLIALVLSLLMLLLVLAAAFVFTYQAQNTLETRVTTLEAETSSLRTEGTRTAAELTDVDATRSTLTSLQATADATNLKLEEELVGSAQEINALTTTRDELEAERDSLLADLETANSTITQYEERFLAQPPQVTLAAPADRASFAAGEPIRFIVAAGDPIGISRIDFTINGNTVSYPVPNQRLLTQPITHTLAAPGVYTATITVLNVSQLATSTTTTVRILSAEAAQQATVAGTLSALRNSSPPVPDPIYLIPRAEFDAWLNAVLPTEAAAQQQTAVLQAFGLLPPGTDLVQWREDANAASFAGLYYDPALDQVFALTQADASGDLAEWLLARDLATTTPLSATFAAGAPGGTDAAVARQAVVLGEVILQQSLYLYRNEQTRLLTTARLAELQNNEVDLFRTMPDVLRQQWLFPYEAGFAYVADIYRAGGFAALSAARSEPPRTTRQIIDDDAQPPPAVTLPDLLPALEPGWALVESGTWGAFRMQQVLARHAAETLVDLAVTAWSGDHFAVYAHADGTLILVYRLAWQTAAEQAAFTAAYSDYAAKRYGTETREVSTGGLCWEDELTACLFTADAESPAIESLVVVAPDEETAVNLATFITP